MGSEESKRIVRHFYAELDRRRGAAVEDLVSETFVAHLGGAPALDRDAFSAALVGLYAAFPDLQHVVEEVVAEGERVAARLTERGTQRGPFQGVAPTGRVVTMAAQAVHRIGDGRLAELWLVSDGLGRLQAARRHPGDGAISPGQAGSPGGARGGPGHGPRSGPGHGPRSGPGRGVC